MAKLKKHKIVVTGPESSGKTSLAEALASKFEAQLVPEYARTYLNSLERPYVYDDLLIIAKAQAKLIEDVPEDTLVIIDTDLVTVAIWSEFKFAKVDPWIEAQLSTIHIDHYILCYPDIPWEYDPQRENKSDRNMLFQLYEDRLLSLKRPYNIVTSQGDSRYEKAISIIRNM